MKKKPFQKKMIKKLDSSMKPKKPKKYIKFQHKNGKLKISYQQQQKTKPGKWKYKQRNQALLKSRRFKKQKLVTPKQTLQSQQQHAYITFSTEKRLSVLYTVMKNLQSVKAVIVMNSDSGVKFLEELLPRLDEKSTATFLYESEEDAERESILAEFAKSKSGILICTEKNLETEDGNCLQNYLTIQFDPPACPEKYLDRLERITTGDKGRTLLFLHEQEKEFVDYAAQSRAISLKQFFLLSKLKDMQMKLEGLHKQSYSVYITAKQACTSYVKLYNSYRQKYFNLSQLGITQIGKSFGFVVPPRVELEDVSTDTNKRKIDNEQQTTKKKKTKTKRKFVLVNP